MTTSQSSVAPRLKALTGPDREIDAEIALANGWRKPEWGVKSREIYWRAPDGSMFPGPLRYTEDILAALTLKPEGAQWEVGSDPEGGFMATVHVDTGSDIAVLESYEAATPAIALLIAIEEAKEAAKQEESKP